MRDLTKCEVELYYAWHGVHQHEGNRKWIKGLVQNRKMVVGDVNGGIVDPNDDRIWLVNSGVLEDAKEMYLNH